jgi:hypothetical protein
MHSLKVSIPGSFWDSQIYSGELTVFGSSGDMYRLNWKALIDNLADKNESVRTGLRIAFSDSDLLYNAQVRRILMDPAIRAPITSQLELAAGRALEFERGHISAQLDWLRADSPFDFLPTDTDIYYHKIFAAGETGLFSASRGAATSNLFDRRSEKHHDASMFQIKGSPNCTAVVATAADDGLFEFPLEKSGTSYRLGRGTRLASRPCIACDWTFNSVLGSGGDGGFLASFVQAPDPITRKVTRRFSRIVETSEIFEDVDIDDAIVWGCREKIYLAKDEVVHIADYVPPEPVKSDATVHQKETFESRGTKDRTVDSGPIVATGTAPFGTIFEFSNSLRVERSDGGSETFAGELVHWRVFPRSEHYSNQLHLIYEDRLDVVSFVHDYFVDQQSKVWGFSRGVTNL